MYYDSVTTVQEKSISFGIQKPGSLNYKSWLRTCVEGPLKRQEMNLQCYFYVNKYLENWIITRDIFTVPSSNCHGSVDLKSRPILSLMH